MLAYTAEITQPNGYLPMLGATATTYMPSQDPNVYGPMAAAGVRSYLARAFGDRLPPEREPKP